ncbi:MAG: hypothetical protein HRT35_20525 [Algicola sp.]|nr:hypothetical protein [Algicola sp.]
MEKNAIHFLNFLAKRIGQVKLQEHIAIVAFISSVVVVFYTVSHNEKMTTPILQISTFEKQHETPNLSDDTVGIKVENLGLGPAQIKHSGIYIFNGKEGFSKVDEMADFNIKMAQIGWVGNFNYTWSHIEPDSYLSIDKRKNVITLEKHRPSNWEQGKNILISICYCSIYEQCFYVSSVDYHQISSCSAYDYGKLVIESLREANKQKLSGA